MLRRASRKKRRFWSIRPLPNADKCNGLETNASASTDTQSSTSAGEYFLNTRFIGAKTLSKVYYELYLRENIIVPEFSLPRGCLRTRPLHWFRIIGRDLTLFCGYRKDRRRFALEGAHREDSTI